MCNTRAEVPGLAAYGAQQLEAHGVRGADFPPEWAPLCAKEGAACDDPDDSEQGGCSDSYELPPIAALCPPGLQTRIDSHCVC